MKRSIIAFLCIICVAIVAIGITRTKPSVTLKVPLNASPTPTPFLFQQMTIPYLRKKIFKSQITRLEKIEHYALYTSYRASYISDGLTIYGLLTIPNGDKPVNGWPAIVFLHGYIPPTVYTTTGQYVAYVDYLARNGFVVFKPDLRGHDRSEGVAGGGYYSSDYVVDTLNAYAAVSTLPYVNPKGIGLWGHSMSGNVVMRAFAAKPTIPAVVIWAGAGYTYDDLLQYRITDTSYRPPVTDTNRPQQRQRLRDTYGDFKADSPFWRQVAVTDYLNDLKGAIQIHHAINDDVVSIEYSRNLIQLLDTTSVPHELFEYPDGGHNISGMSFAKAMERTVEFFKQKLTK